MITPGGGVDAGAGPPEGLVVGVGARASAGREQVGAVLARVAEEHRLDLAGAVVATVEARRAMLTEALAPTGPGGGVPGDATGPPGVFELVAWPPGVLARVDVPHPSGRVAAATGTPSVAEAAALHTARLRAGPDGDVTLVVPKTAGDGVTVAVARYRTR